MRVRTLSSGFFCSSILTLRISGLTLAQEHAPALVAVLGIVAVWAVPTVIALALCRAAAPDARLQRAAEAHSESMALNDYFEHDGPQRETPLSATGYISSARIGYEVGENIGWGTLWEGAPRAIVAAWMASPGHRANIVDARFRDSAVGVSPHLPSSLARGQAGAIYTEDFGDLR